MTPDASPIQMFCGDALAVMRSLPDGSVDLAAFDPPYKTISGGSGVDKTGKHQRPTGMLAKNDGKIFENNDITPSEYLPEIYRVLRPAAHMYIMTNTYNLVQNDLIGDLRRAGFEVHNLLFWRKNNATPNRWYMKDTELTLFCRKGRAFQINKPGTRSTMAVDPHKDDSPFCWLTPEEIETFEYPLDWDNVGSPKSHPTEKPVNLMKSYIENSAQFGDMVLDPFAGTGATGVAAAKLGCDFIGIEMAEGYAEYAASRLGVAVSRLAVPRFDLDDLLGPEPSVDDLLG